MGKLKLQCPFPRGIDEWFQIWPKARKKVLFGNIYNILPSLIIWEIWKERNRRIFEDKEMPQIALCGKIEKNLIEFMNEASKQKTLK